MIRACDGCGKQHLSYATLGEIRVPRGALYLCVWQRGEQMGRIKGECFAEALRQTCLVCNGPQDTYHRNLVCEACERRLKRSEAAEKEAVDVALVGSSPWDGGFSMLRDLLDPSAVHVENTQRVQRRIGEGKSGYVLRLTLDQAEALERFVQRAHDSIRHLEAMAFRRGRALLAALASGEIGVSAFEERTEKESKR